MKRNVDKKEKSRERSRISLGVFSIIALITAIMLFIIVALNHKQIQSIQNLVTKEQEIIENCRSNINILGTDNDSIFYNLQNTHSVLVEKFKRQEGTHLISDGSLEIWAAILTIVFVFISFLSLIKIEKELDKSHKLIDECEEVVQVLLDLGEEFSIAHIFVGLINQSFETTYAIDGLLTECRKQSDFLRRNANWAFNVSEKLLNIKGGYKKNERLSLAEEIMKKILCEEEIDTKDQYYLLLGHIYKHKQETEKAKTYYERVVKESFNKDLCNQARYYLSDLMLRNGDLKIAEKYIRENMKAYEE